MRCEHCGADQRIAMDFGSTHCTPPFAVRLHAFTGNHPADIKSPPPATSCGTCRLWAPTFHAKLPASARGTGCCADVVMDLPASWSTNAPMLKSDGEDCCAWEAA